MKTFSLKNFMLIILMLFLFLSFEKQECHSQVYYWQETITHNPCPGDSLGSIEISFQWGTPFTYSILWSNGATTEDIYFLPSGNYSVTIYDPPPLYFSYEHDFTVGVSTSIQINETIVDATAPGANNGEIHLNISGGSGNYIISWAHGDTTASITDLYAGVYYVTISDTLSCAIDAEHTYFVEAPLPPGWEVTTTNTSHTLFLETSTCVNIGDSTLSSGSLIGVFHDEGGQPVCRGYSFWNQQENMITVFFPDSTANYTSPWSQEFYFKVYEATSSQEFDAQVCCLGSNSSYMCNLFAPWMNNSEISCIYIENSYNQTLSFYQGWNTFSVALEPDPAGLEAMFAPIINDIKIIKDGYGLVYWPEYNVNFIGNVEIGKGYQVKTLSAQSLTVNGYHIYPELIPFTPPNGWSMFGYYSNTPIGPQFVFGVPPFTPSPIELIKDGYGNIWWPFYQLDWIPYLNSGIGYWIKVNFQETYYFPSHECY